jgi:formylglycine-generating enzyme required for sulfatase activity
MDADLPEVDAGPGCDDLEPPPEGRVCIDQGWFVLAQWSPLSPLTTLTPFVTDVERWTAHDDQAVFLSTFLIDRTEVTNSEYEARLDEWALPIPDCGDMTDGIWWDGCDSPYEFSTTSSWEDGAPKPGVEMHPVRCIPKTAARAFCAGRGGRLPTFYEWFKAAAGAFPASPSYPWGEDQPSSEFMNRVVDLVPGMFRPLPEVGPVGRYPLGASHYGVLDLVGGVSELVGGCISDTTSGAEPRVRPRVRSECADEHLVAGSNWLSDQVCPTGVEAVAPALYAARADQGWLPRFLGPEDHALGQIAPIGVPFNAPDDGRSWRTGFRCAYDIE